MVTGAIVLAAIALVVWAIASPERRRRRAVEELGVGADTAAVVAALGRPGARCPAGALDGLRGRFPTGTSAAGEDAWLRTLAPRTRERWVFAPPGERDGGCRVRSDGTEMGIDHAGRVVWYVAGAGRTPLVLPDTVGGAASP